MINKDSFQPRRSWCRKSLILPMSHINEVYLIHCGVYALMPYEACCSAARLAVQLKSVCKQWPHSKVRCTSATARDVDACFFLRALAGASADCSCSLHPPRLLFSCNVMPLSRALVSLTSRDSLGLRRVCRAVVFVGLAQLSLSGCRVQPELGDDFSACFASLCVDSAE